MRLYSTLLVALLSVVGTPAYAGAWTQESGKGLIIINGLYYSTDRLYNGQGTKASQAQYSKYELNPYFEYGLSGGITVGANLSLQRASQLNQSNWGLGDSEFFLRARLFQYEGLVISAEPMVKLPSPENARETPQLGGRHPDAGLGISAGYGFSMWGLNHFANFDAQYRYRFDAPKDQVKVAGTLGVSVTPHWMIMPQAFITQRTDTPAIATFTQSSGDDYNLLKLQLSAVYKFRDDVSLQVGAFSHVDGKNVGAGSGGLVSIWKTF